MTGPIGYPMSERQRTLRRTRLRARKKYAARVKAGDVIHWTSNAVEVLALRSAPRSSALPFGGAEITVRDEFPDGTTHTYSVRRASTLELLVYRPPEAP